MSPIETKLLNELRRGYRGVLLSDWTIGDPPISFSIEDGAQFQDNFDWQDIWIADSHDHYIEAALSAQVPILSYRADFMISAEGRHVSIECDGHDYHERTKQQAAYDRSRDRDLLKLDIATIRFTGSEIHHSPERCAADVWAVVCAIAKRDTELQRAFKNGVASGERDALRPLCAPGSMAGVL